MKSDSLDAVLFSHGRVDVSTLSLGELADDWYLGRNDVVARVGTVLNNMAFYGVAPSQRLLDILASADADSLGKWWENLDKTLWEVKGMDRNMDSHVVYKNFPKEVLHMDDSEYWIRQIFMYLGVPKEAMAQPPVDRPELSDDVKMLILHPADRGASELMHELQQQTTRWSDEQRESFVVLVNALKPERLSMADFGFRENPLELMADPDQSGLSYIPELEIQDATDVARLASCMSTGEVRLADPVTFASMPRSARRKIVELLENSKNLEADVAQRKSVFKKLFQRLHPGDFKAPRVQAVYDELFNKRLESYSAKVERLIQEGSPEALTLLAQRPGEVVRRYRVLVEVFGQDAVGVLDSVASKLSTRQLLKLFKYIRTFSQRKYRTIAPNGFWHKLQVIENTVPPMNDQLADESEAVISHVLEERLKRALPEGVDCRGDLDRIKLKANDQALFPVGSGTRYRIPDNCNYLRTGSYWEFGSGSSSVWYDNTWNFFGDQWEPMGACCWNSEKAHGKAAVMSGDPVPGMDEGIRGCQLIDLYIDQLVKKGVRYAVWSILCYSGKPFSAAKDVLGTLQWGENPEAGNLYEPSRAQFVLPMKDSSLNKFVAYVDLKTRELVLMDVTLPVAVSSGMETCEDIARKMPALLEHFHAQPSLADLMQFAPNGAVPVAESDADQAVVAEKAYVFERVNGDSDFSDLDVEALLCDNDDPEQSEL